MKAPRPMRTTGTDLERLLFNSGAAEKPDTRTVQNAARGLNLFPKALLIGGAFAFVVRNARAASIAVFSLVPLGAIAIVAMGLIQRSGAQVSAVPSRSAPSATGAIRDPLAAAPAVAPALEQPPPDTVPPPRYPAAPRSKARALSVATPVDNLGEQAEALNRARALLDRGRASAALAAIDDYDRRFRSGPLSEEALLLRIEGLAQHGERNAAADLGRRFLLRYPASVHADQVVALLGSPSP
jgi:hypothetical protein